MVETFAVRIVMMHVIWTRSASTAFTRSFVHTHHTTRLPVVSTVHARFRVIPSSCCIHVLYTCLPSSTLVIRTLDIHVETLLKSFSQCDPGLLASNTVHRKRHHLSSLLLTQFAKLKFVDPPAVKTRIYTRNRNSSLPIGPFPIQHITNFLS
jgi:hypothetical protein